MKENWVTSNKALGLPVVALETCLHSIPRKFSIEMQTQNVIFQEISRGFMQMTYIVTFIHNLQHMHVTQFCAFKSLWLSFF